MDKMKNAARRLDIFFRILQIACTVAAVTSAVILLMIGACFLFGLDPEMIGTGYNMLELGFMEFELAQAYAPSSHTVLLISAAEMAFALPAALLGRACMGRVRALLAPMKEGLPFHNEASNALKRLALMSLVLGALISLSEAVNHVLLGICYNPAELFASEKILSTTLHYDMDLSFLLVSGILLLLSYVFRYGQGLQQLSDETL